MPDPAPDPLFDALLARVPVPLDEARIATLREQVRSLREAAAALRAVPLTNADEPDTAFAAVSGVDTV